MPIDLSQASATIAGVPCIELVRGNDEGIASGRGPELTKAYACNWADRFKVANALIGVTTVYTSGGPVSFDLPLRHPESPNAFARDVKITGRGKPYQGPYQLAFDVAEITVRYAAPAYGIIPSPEESMQGFDPDTTFIYCTQSINHAEEMIEIPGNCLVYQASGGNKPFVKPLMVPFAHAVFSLTFHEMPYLPVNTLQYYNHTNNGKFLGISGQGKVRFKGSGTVRNWSTTGPPTQTVTNTYEYRPSYDWNMMPNPIDSTSSDWAKVSYKDGSLLYPYADLMQTLPQGYF